MKTINLYHTLSSVFFIWLMSHTAFAQNISEEDIMGTWEKAGVIMGKNGEGWVMPHKHTAPDCGEDHTVFFPDGNGKEVTYNKNCEPVEKPFVWKLENSQLRLSKEEKNITWHLLSLEDNQLKVGIQIRPNSERRMYVVYNRSNNK